MRVRLILVSIVFGVMIAGPSGCEKGPPSSTEAKQKASPPPPVSGHEVAEQPTPTQPKSGPSVPPLSKEHIEAAEKAGVEPAIEIDLGKGVTMKMVLIPAGTFMMGSPDSEEGRYADEAQHEVTLTKPFYMGITEVTQAQWQAVMGTRPWEGEEHAKANPLHAASYVTWHDCQEFLRRLNAKVHGGGFRLPTEAEWEYACRAGSTTRFHYGDDPDYSQLGRYAWYDGNAGSRGEKYSHAVGVKKPNGYGLYDMHGNVWEWCQDRFGEYARGRAINPTGPGVGTDRVLRGGSCLDLPRHCRSAFRSELLPSYRYRSFGFRCVRTVVAP